MQKNDMKTILLVEDEAIISLSTSKILQKNGFNVITVHKGEKAVDAVRDFTTIDIVLMDINLGKGMDGAEAAEQILRIRALPVVFLTSHSEQAVVDRIKSITRYGYVIKNSGEFVLLESINMALELFDANRNLLNDIKKREQAEAELKSSEVKFSTVFHASPAGICINDAEDGRFIDVNKAFERITGLNRLELLGKDPLGLGLWSYEYAEEISAELQSSGKLFNREILYTSKITGNRNVVISCEFISLNGRNCVLTIVNDVTDQKLNLEALAESRKILNSTHRTAMLESWIYDYNTKQLHLGNRGNLSGFEEKQISGFDFFIQKTHPEDLEFHRKEIQKLLDGKPVLFKVRVILDEMTRWFLVQADIELDSSEKPVKAFGVTIDITGSKAVEEENLKHISLLKATLESTADGILVVDLKRKISSYNKRFTEMWGINEELMFTGNDNTVIRFVLGQLEAADEFIERVEWLYHHPAEESFDTIRFKDGRLFERYSIPQIIDDEIAGRVWNFRDVTEKNNFEKALKRSEERTKAIINSVPDLLFVLDNKGVFIDYFSRSDEHLYVPVNRFMGKHLYDIFDKELADEAIRKIESAIENRVIEKLEYSLNMNGDVKYFEDRIAPISDNEVLTIIRDITDEKKKEEALLVRENVLAKITDFAGLIFNSGVNDESINHFLAELGKAFSVSRAYIFRKIFETDEMISFRQINEWCDEGVISSSEVLDVENFVVDKSSPYMIKVSSLIKEGFLPGNMNEMDNEYEKYLMEVQNLKSYLFISIYIKNTFWGMIGFDECKRLRKWEDFEIQVLKTAAYIIGGALQKDKMERELADNKQLYFTLVNSSPDSVSVTDLNGNLIFSSKHAMELFGYEPDENTDGLSVFSWVSPQFQELAYTKFSEIIKTGKTESASFILNRKDGSEFYAEITASRFDDGDGNPRGLIIVTRDITEVLKTRLALEEEAISRRILIEGSSDGIVVVDDSGKAIEVNRKFCEMLGYTHAELKNMHVCQWDDKFNRSDLEKMIESVDEKGDFFETVHKRKDGSVYDVEVSSNAAIVNGRKQIFCVCRDITKRKAIQKIIKESEEKFSKIFHNSPVGISINRISDGMYIDVNEALLKIGGFTRAEVIGRTTIELNVYDEKTRKVYMNKLKKHGKVSNEEITYLRRDGTFANVIISMELIEINGEMNILGTAIDVTDKKNSQAELLKSLDEKNILLKELQHRVKNNLTVISSLLNLEMGNLDDKNSINIFQNSITRINSLSSIYEQLYSTDDITRIDLNIYLSNLIESLERTYKINDKILLITSVKEGTFIDLKRAVLIGLIFNELITNSMKYAYPAGGEGAIHSGISIENGVAALYVKDYGKGMPDGFDMNSVKSLGLKLVKMLSEQLEGTLKIDPHEGTCVSIKFKI